MVDWNYGVMASPLLVLSQNLTSQNLGGFTSQWFTTPTEARTQIYVSTIPRVSNLPNSRTRVLRRWRSNRSYELGLPSARNDCADWYVCDRR